MVTFQKEGPPIGGAIWPINLSEWRDRTQIAAGLLLNRKLREANLEAEQWHGIG